MSQNSHRPPITVEELLRIKRAERPSPEFWTGWDRQLRTKQLAAILDKRPWWRDALPRFGIALARLYRPLGVAAILTLTLVTVHEYRSAGSAPLASVAAPAAHATAANQNDDAKVDGVLTELRQPAVVARTETTDASAQPGNSSRAGTMLAATHERSVETTVRPETRAIATNLAFAQTSEPNLGRMLPMVAGIEPLKLGGRVQVEEPLTRLPTPRDVRRERLLSYSYNASSATDSSVVTASSRERLISRLKEDQFYEPPVHRLGASANSVSLKF